MFDYTKFSFGHVMPPLKQKSRVLHVVTDNKQRTKLKALRNLWHFETHTKNRGSRCENFKEVLKPRAVLIWTQLI